MVTSAWIPCAGTTLAGTVPVHAATAARKSAYACSGYIQEFGSSRSTSSSTPSSGPDRSSFQFSFQTSSSPWRALSSARLSPGS